MACTSRKKKRRDAVRILKPCCGTLNYLAESRGSKRSQPVRGMMPEGRTDRDRKYPAVL